MRLDYVQAGDKKFRDWMRRYREELGGEPPSEAWLDKYLTAIFNEQGKHRHIWWAVDEGKRVGFAIAMLTPSHLDSLRVQGNIGEFYIYPEFRREGYGRRLATEVINFLASHGASEIHCTVLVGNVGGLRFWETMGFQLTRYHLSAVAPRLAPR
ncbi:MAG: GNAT family N-acetyltransferase [Armatimonadetes bacterium]|nr:GNAT family N-acetyltransferase [Armatimonadota bacterium]